MDDEGVLFIHRLDDFHGLLLLLVFGCFFFLLLLTKHMSRLHLMMDGLFTTLSLTFGDQAAAITVVR